MAFVRFVFNLLGIIAPAVVVAALLPEWLGVRLEFALIAGILVFLLGVSILEVNGRREADRRLREEIHALRAGQVAVRDELAGARREMKALEEALQAAATLRGGQGGSQVYRGRGLADPALLVGDGNRAGHRVSMVTRLRGSSTPGTSSASSTKR